MAVVRVQSPRYQQCGERAPSEPYGSCLQVYRAKSMNIPIGYLSFGSVSVADITRQLMFFRGIRT